MSVKFECDRWTEFKLPTFDQICDKSAVGMKSDFDEVDTSDFADDTGKLFDGWNDQYGRQYEDGELIPYNYINDTLILSARWVDRPQDFFFGVRVNDFVSDGNGYYSNSQLSGFFEFDRYDSMQISEVKFDIFRVSIKDESTTDDTVFNVTLQRRKKDGSEWEDITEPEEIEVVSSTEDSYTKTINANVKTDKKTIEPGDVLRLISNISYDRIKNGNKTYTNVGVRLFYGGANNINYIPRHQEKENFLTVSENIISTSPFESSIFGELEYVTIRLNVEPTDSYRVETKYDYCDMNCRLSMSKDGVNYYPISRWKKIRVSMRNNKLKYDFDLNDDVVIRKGYYLQLDTEDTIFSNPNVQSFNANVNLRMGTRFDF